MTGRFVGALDTNSIAKSPRPLLSILTCFLICSQRSFLAHFDRSNDKVMFGAAGCWCDVVTFSRVLEIRSKMYRYDHNQELSHKSAAQLISTMLYNRRFFPYYIDTIVAGLDENGKGWVYHYDPVGNYEPLRYSCSGSGSALIMPFLDNQVGKKNMENVTPGDLELDEALMVVKDALTSASEREITCGDDAHICIITKDGIREEKMEMRRD